MDAVMTPPTEGTPTGNWLSSITKEAQADVVPEQARRRPATALVDANKEPLPSRAVQMAEDVAEQEEAEEAVDEEIVEGDEVTAEEAVDDKPQPAQPTPKVQEPPKVDAPQYTFEQAQQAYYNQFLITAVRNAGVTDVKEDGGNLREIIAANYAADPLGWQTLFEQAKGYAVHNAQQYHQKFIAPYQTRTAWEQNKTFCERFERQFPDVNQYQQQMVALYKTLQTEWPELAGDPARAIPMLYQMAKEKPLARAAAAVRGAKPKARLDPGGARTSRTQPSKKADPLDNLFGTQPDPFK